MDRTWNRLFATAAIIVAFAGVSACGDKGGATKAPADKGVAEKAADQAVVQVFSPLPSNSRGFDAGPSSKIERLKKEQGSDNIGVVVFNAKALTEAKPNSARAFDLPQGRLDSVTQDVTDLTEGRKLWKGRIQGAAGLPAGDATLVVDGANATGTISAPDGRQFKVQPLGDGATAIIQMDYSKLPKEEPPGHPKYAAPGGGAATADVQPGAAAANLTAVPTIDLLVGYTASAATASGGINSLIDVAIAETNQSFVNSGIRAKVRLAGKMAVPIVEGTNDFDHILAAFVQNPAVAAQRNATHADVAVLIINKTDYCGLADDIKATAPTAFVIVHYGCATGYYSFGHEIGHLMGARHNKPTDPTTAPYPYGHGFIHHGGGAAGWRTIMGYNCDDGTCDRRVQYWSNPAVKYQTFPTGTTAAENNTRVWNERAATVAAFR